MAGLLDTSPQNMTLHLKSLYEDGEITEAATCKEFLQVRQEGSRTISLGSVPGPTPETCVRPKRLENGK